MLNTRRNVRPLVFRSSGESTPDTRFPRAVAGEAFDRYARAMWNQAQRWTRAHWHRVSVSGLSMHDAREILRSYAAHDLTRCLYPQEEQLLSEVLQVAWNDAAREMPDIVPEVPSFLLGDSPRPPRPAA